MAYGMYQRDMHYNGMIDLNDMRNFSVFEHADRNHDGRLNVHEFAQSAAPYLGINPIQTGAVFRAADINNDGVLTREEMNNVADFKRADLNHDGRVDPYEMQVYRGGRFGVGNLPPQFRLGGSVYGLSQNNYNSSSYIRY